MRKPLIGITAGEVYDRDHEWAPLVYGQLHTYYDAIIVAGGIPVVMPITIDDSVLDSLSEQLDGFLFAGGNDPHPSLYGEQQGDYRNDASAFRDACEMKLINKIFERKKPILGICRGMEMLNIAKGGSLYQDILKDIPNAKDHEVSETNRESVDDIVHLLTVKESTKLHEIIKSTELPTNTHHHQAVKHLGDGVIETATAADGIIEAVEITDYPFAIGIQSHPESLLGTEPKWRQLFDTFVQAAQT